MSDEIKTKLKEACVGRPAKIPWPHFVLHEAHHRIEALEADLAVATARADALAGKIRQLKANATTEWVPSSVIHAIADAAPASIQETPTDD